LFEDLNEEALEEVAERLTPRIFPAGRRLFLEGETPHGLYVLLEGSVKLSRTSACGREVMVSLVHAPSTVAETVLFDGGPHPASASSVEESEGGFIATADFARLCRRYPDIPLRALRLAGERVRELMGTVERVRFGSVRQRLAAELLYLAAGNSAPVTHQELASRLGTAREVITRTMARLRAEGLVEFNGRRIEVLDRVGLEQLCE
jgi:CRP/FNR family transcriptional regulator